MGWVLEGLVIYVLVCLVFMTVVMFRNLNKVVAELPPRTRYSDFVAGALFVVLMSPISVPVILVKTIRKVWQEIIDQCQSSDENQH